MRVRQNTPQRRGGLVDTFVEVGRVGRQSLRCGSGFAETIVKVEEGRLTLSSTWVGLVDNRFDVDKGLPKLSSRSRRVG